MKKMMTHRWKLSMVMFFALPLFGVAYHVDDRPLMVIENTRLGLIILDAPDVVLSHSNLRLEFSIDKNILAINLR